MKKITTFLSLTLLKATLVFSQSGVLSAEDYKYYFRTTNNEIRDSRDFKVVTNHFPDGETRLSIDNKYVIVHSGSIIYCMELSGKLVAKTNIPANARLSPDWDKIIFVENGDIWKSDVNCKTGKIDNKQKVTELGIFGSNCVFNIASWYKDIVAMPMDFLTSEDLRIDLHNKQIEPLFVTQEMNYSRIDGSPSPDGRYLIHTGYNSGANIKVNDLKNNKITTTEVFSSDRLQQHIWLNDYQVLLQGKLDNPYVSEYDYFIFDFTVMQVVKNFPKIPAFSRITNPTGSSASNCVSLNGTHVLLHKYSDDNTKGSFLILDVKSGEVFKSLVGESAKDYIWLSDDELIFSEGGSINRQGTWILNVNSKEVKKVTNFQSTGYVNLPEIGQVLFSANNYIWRVNHDGTGLLQLTYTPQNYFGVKSLVNFRRLEFINGTTPQNSVQKTDPSNPPKVTESGNKMKQTGIVKTKQGSNLRVRSEASDKANIISQIPNGATVNIIEVDGKQSIVNGEKGSWLKIEYFGTIGWAWGNFIVRE
jgi:hypothetical protein